MTEQKDDFSDFEDDVVDMTDPNRKKNTYGSYHPVYDPEDSYGAYSAKNDRLVTKGNSGERAMNLFLDLLYILGLIAALAGIGYAVYEHITDKDEFIHLMTMSLSIMEVTFIINAIVLFKRHRNPALLLTAIILPVFFPFVRGNVSGRFKFFSYLWLIALILLGVIFSKNDLEEMRYGFEEKKSYSGEYNNVISNLKNQKGDYDVKLIKVIRTFFNKYTISVESDSDQTIVVKIEGNLTTNIELSGQVGGDVSESQPKKFAITYNVERIDGKYSVAGMTLDGVDASNSMSLIWQRMCDYTKKN